MDGACSAACILFEDAHIVVVRKPYGLLSEAHDRQPNMPAILRQCCGCEVFPVHRLDKTTEGLMVYAKTRDAAAELSRAVREGEVEKTYLAVAEGAVGETGQMTDWLFFDRFKGKSFVVRRERRGVKHAALSYERLATAEKNGRTLSLVKIHLQTGRTHQIRVQFASRKMPLVGDRRYGSHIEAESIALCAAGLSFPHPVTGERMSFCCEADFASDFNDI